MPIDPLQQQLQTSLGTACRLERELGGGGMARVFVARDQAPDRTVVVRVLAPGLAEGSSADRLTREIRLAAAPRGRGGPAPPASTNRRVARGVAASGHFPRGHPV